jgi:hypothetical protein
MLTNVTVLRMFPEDKVGEFVPVSVDRETFNATRGSNPKADFKPRKTEDGKNLREFEIEGGVKLYGVFDRDESAFGRNRLFMRETDAKRLINSELVVPGLAF